MRIFLLTIGFLVGGILCSSAQAQTIPLTIDPTQSSVSISIAGAQSDSPLSGSTTLEMEMEPSDALALLAPPANSQITDLNLVLDDALDFSLFSGFASGSTSPSGVTISMVTPGDVSTLTGNPFAQSANQIALDGDLQIIDSLGFAGGNQTFDLSGVNLSPVDFNSVNVTRLGSLITISSSFTITENINLGTGDVPMVLEVNYVASGIVPEPVLLGDVNLDGDVSPSDIIPFISILAANRFQAEADCNESEAVNFLDIFPFVVQLMAP